MSGSKVCNFNQMIFLARCYAMLEPLFVMLLSCSFSEVMMF